MNSTLTAPTQPARGHRKVKFGLVISNRMAKTIVVRVSRLVKHPKYSRIIKQTSSFKAHDEVNQAKVGDWVKIMETRPLSKEKRWRLVEIVAQGSSAPLVPGEASEPAIRKTRPHGLPSKAQAPTRTEPEQTS